MGTFLESGKMGVDEIHKLVDLFPDPNLFVGLNRQPFLDLIDISALDFAERGINMCKNLFPQLLKIVIKFLDCVVGLLLLRFKHQNPLLLKVAFSFVEFLFAFPP